MGLSAIVQEEFDKPVPDAVSAMVTMLMERHGKDRIEAALYYGSCFRDGVIKGGLLDIYLLVDDYTRFHASTLKGLANYLLPPNVYYAEIRFGSDIVRAKYAVVTTTQFERLVGGNNRNPYFWARFSQPTGLIYAKDGIKKRVEAAMIQSIEVMHAHACSVSASKTDVDQFWSAILSQTYQTELRVEKPQRTREIVQTNRRRFHAISASLGTKPHLKISKAPWTIRRIEGKILSILRLTKAAFTFGGGPDYLVWKIKRHSGYELELSPWQKRHPILASGPILYRLWRAKKIR